MNWRRGRDGACARCGVLASIVEALVSVIGVLYRRIDALEEVNRGMAMRTSELEARKGAAERQALEARKALVDMAGDLGRERARADREAGDRERAAEAGDRERAAEAGDRERAAEAEAAREDLLCDLATARAQAELLAAERPAKAAACANDLMSRPDLAVSTALSARRPAAEAGGQGGEGGGGGADDALAAENARLKKENARLRRDSAPGNSPDTPSSTLSLANARRKVFREVTKLPYRKKGEAAARSRGG